MNTITIAILSSIAVSIIMRRTHVTNISYSMCSGILNTNNLMKIMNRDTPRYK